MKRWVIWTTAFCTIVLAGNGAITACWADQLISFTDTLHQAWGMGFFYQSNLRVYSASWTQTVSTTNTTIGVVVTKKDTVTGQGRAYLTNALGPEATIDNLIATTDFTPPYQAEFVVEPAPETTLFTGLSLGPGTYYLVLEQTDGLILWWGDCDANADKINTADGFSVEAYRYATPFVESYPPSSSFNTLTYNTPEGVDILFYSVKTTAVPLPPTVLLLGSGLLGLVGWRRFRKS